MNASVENFIGIDVSKEYFDACLLAVKDHQKKPFILERFANSKLGLKVFEKWLSQHGVPMNENTLLVIENTGIYQRLLWSFCSTNNLPIHIGNAAQIKWSMGITRIKNDKVDSKRLCEYGYKNADTLKATPCFNVELTHLKDLIRSRSNLINQLASNKKYLKELNNINPHADQRELERIYKPAIEGLMIAIKKIETRIREIIAANKELKNNFDLLITVPGLGWRTAIYLICCTNNFGSEITGKQLACYAGVVPFEYSSGKSIKGKNKVHKMANKELKKMLHMCALSTINRNAEFKAYYERKKAEGKNAMSVLNAIRNKIVLRAAAVVKNQKPYVNNYQKAA